MPQPPQASTLDDVLVSQPLVESPSQLPQPAVHDGTQAPELHWVVPCALVHWMLQPPQWFTLLEMFCSQPLPVLPSQSANPGAQPS